MELARLVEMYNAGFMKISENADGTYTFGTKSKNPVTLDESKSNEVINGLGWEKYTASIGKVVSHMCSFVRAAKSAGLSDDEMSSCEIRFEQSYMPNTTKNVWRTRFYFYDKSFTIVEGHAGMGGRYAVMSSEDNFCNFAGFPKLVEAIKNIFERAKPKGVYDGYTEDELHDVMELEARVNGTAVQE